MVPYFTRVMEHMKIYLTGQLTPEEMPLQVQALGKKVVDCFSFRFLIKHSFF